jgi:hypothetical protein
MVAEECERRVKERVGIHPQCWRLYQGAPVASCKELAATARPIAKEAIRTVPHRNDRDGAETACGRQDHEDDQRRQHRGEQGKPGAESNQSPRNVRPTGGIRSRRAASSAVKAKKARLPAITSWWATPGTPAAGAETRSPVRQQVRRQRRAPTIGERDEERDDGQRSKARR